MVNLVAKLIHVMHSIWANPSEIGQPRLEDMMQENLSQRNGKSGCETDTRHA